MRYLLLAVLVVAVAACGATASPLTGQAVLDDFKAAGLEVENSQQQAPDPALPIPNSYQDWYVFSIPSAGQHEDGSDRGGQIFVCATKANCDAIVAYFDAFKALAGPYLYQSPDGRVVVQLNSGLRPDVAAEYDAALQD